MKKIVAGLAIAGVTLFMSGAAQALAYVESYPDAQSVQQERRQYENRSGYSGQRDRRSAFERSQVLEDKIQYLREQEVSARSYGQYQRAERYRSERYQAQKELSYLQNRY